jgi:hypothetical protein
VLNPRSASEFVETTFCFVHYLRTVLYQLGSAVNSAASERDAFLAKLKWAEEMASQQPEGFYRESWLGIAEGYRELLNKLDESLQPQRPLPEQSSNVGFPFNTAALRHGR